MHRHTLPTQLPEGCCHWVGLVVSVHTGTAKRSRYTDDIIDVLKEVFDYHKCFWGYFRFCLKNCPPNDLECALSPYALDYKLLSLPFGIAANQDLIRLVAYTQDGVVHPRTSFLVVDEDATLPFAIRDENLKGVLYTTQPLREPHTYRMKVRALSYGADGGIEYQTTFIVYIAVSAYPY